MVKTEEQSRNSVWENVYFHGNLQTEIISVQRQTDFYLHRTDNTKHGLSSPGCNGTCVDLEPVSTGPSIQTHTCTERTQRNACGTTFSKRVTGEPCQENTHLSYLYLCGPNVLYVFLRTAIDDFFMWSNKVLTIQKIIKKRKN